ncbi:hypothetical protein AbraIFM66951_008390 [Aspergillus brasiliensis]|nr:hypothetical protein AbraIFM66951_008390 [Aspergillus brasiliensis]
MLSVRATIADIERLVGTGPDAPTYELSCQNTHQDTVIGGSIADLNAIREKLEPEGIKCVNVDVPYAFHTAQMDAVRERLAKAVAAVPFKTPSVPVLSPLLGSVVFDGKSINPEYIVRATREPVQFATAIDAAQELGIVNNQTLWVDIGPHPICASFVRSLVPGARIVSSCRRNEDNFTTMAKSLCTLHLAGRTPSWAEYFRPDEQAYSLLRLPKYRWNEVNYWIQYLGTWTLDKAHLKNGSVQKRAITDVPSVSSLRTSLIHQVTEETVDKTTATLKAISDIQHPDFLEAVHGHRMNNCGVATSSIWTDMAMTVGEHLYRLLVPGTDHVLMDLCDFEVQHAQVANTNSNTPQPLALEAHLDLPTRHMSLAWYDVDATTNQRAAAPFATGSIKYPADATGAAWTTEWSRITHLIQGRIEALQQMAAENQASTLSNPLAYALFKNVVDYAPRYRGMDRVVIHDHEAFSDITLTTDRHGTWHTPPHWIDSVSHLAGLVMNGSDASNTRDFFYVTPGCGSCRMIEPLIAGGKYRNYVRMFPMPDEAHMYAGDLYILRGDRIIGVVEQLKFRRVPRMLMDRFFSPNKNAAHAPATVPAVKKQPATEIIQSQPQPTKQEQKQDQLQLPNLVPASAPSASSSNISSSSSPSPSSSGIATPTTEQDAPVTDTSAVTGVAGKCLELIANETGLGVAELTADATFVQLGVDSLMSLVLSEKLRSEMGLEIKSSLFLECPTVGDLTGWLEQYC